MSPSELVSPTPRTTAAASTQLRSGTRYIGMWVVVAVLSIWMRTSFEIHAIVASGIDDALWLRAAHYLGAGEWLGPYDNLTLAKGMFFPLFLMIIIAAGIPLKFAEQVVYLAVSGLTAHLVSSRTRNRYVGTVLFILLAFNPVLWYWALSRIVREGLYISLSLAVITLCVLVAFPNFEKVRLRRTLLYGVSLGLVTSAFWLTREEGEWLLPAIAGVMLMGLVRIFLEARTVTGSKRVTRLALFGFPVAAAIGCFLTVLVAVASINAAQYGLFVVNEFKSASFQRGYGALARIEQDRWQRYVVFSKDARTRAYGVSPAARELAPFLDGPLGEGWRRIGCTQVWAPDETCSEILSGWFMWALRDAVAQAGYYSSPRQAASFYERLAAEINTACDEGRIKCMAPRATLAPPFRWHYLADSLGPAWQLFQFVLGMGPWNVGSAPSEGSLPGIQAMADMVGPAVPPSRVWHRVIGWVATSTGKPEIAVRSPTGRAVGVSLFVSSGVDVVEAGQGTEAKRFDIETDCAPEACDLVLLAPNTDGVALPWKDLRPGLAADTNGVRVFIDAVKTRDVWAGSEMRRSRQVVIASAAAYVYAGTLPVLTGIGVIGSIFSLVGWRGQREQGFLIALAVASLLAAGSRIALLAYLDATAVPAANLLYIAPATPFVIVLAVTGTYLAWLSFTTRSSNTSPAD
jgi:hypothetical protein